jgi:alkylation response protein AidB-like acyl-CoA dehydrogenase
MSATAFENDLRDQQFVLFEQLRIQENPDPRFREFSRDLYDMVLAEAKKLAEGTVAPLNKVGDREGCTFDNGSVRTPPGYKEAYEAFRQGGWIGLITPQEQGGQGLPISLGLAITETFTGACCAFMMYPGLTSAASSLLRAMGDDWMKSVIFPKLLSGDWTGTMCLTEPQAGSAVGDVRTTAVREGDHYRLCGSKIFVSCGEHDLAENTIHIMLGRTPDAPAGIKGLSLFMVPKVLVGPDGSLGERNDVVCSGIEHKMGINGSATCSLSLGDKGGAHGWIIGREGEGILRMFHMMNEARIAVGVQGLALAAAATEAATDYARERVQGTRIKEFRDAAAERVPIIEHADVKRMLLLCRSQVAGMRALGLMLGHTADLWHGAEARGDEAEAGKLRDTIEVLTPVCKAWNSDQCFAVAATALQVYGGYGYIGEYPAEQYVRDSKIFSIYEGTNGIQALDLVGRKLGMKGGMAFMQVMNGVNERIGMLEGAGPFDAERQALEKARDRLGEAAMHLMGLAMGGDQDLPVAHACDLLTLLGDVVVGSLLADQARVAWGALKGAAASAGLNLDDAALRTAWLNSDESARFYYGKIDNLRFYAHQFLPRTAALAKAITSSDRTVLDAVI